MIIKCYNEKHKYLLFIDLEFNNRELIQFSGLLFTQIDDDGTYQLMRSVNQYVCSKVCYSFTEYTNITNTFLSQNGIPLQELVNFIGDEFLKDINLSELLLISHGLKNDRMVMNDCGINLKFDDNKKPIDGYCTFTNGRRILKRKKRLALSDLATEAGYYIYNAHNAYADVWAEVAVFTYLKKIEEQNKGDY